MKFYKLLSKLDFFTDTLLYRSSKTIEKGAIITYDLKTYTYRPLDDSSLVRDFMPYWAAKEISALELLARQA